jgi:hypothetical protein
MIPPSPVWSGCPQAAADFAACPFSPTLVSRLQALSTSGYFSSTPPGVCAEDYITGTQNGLSQDPTVLSSTLNADGTVSVVIRRGLPPPDLTLTMSDTTGAWLAVDLASGAGASASVFSTHPNC